MSVVGFRGCALRALFLGLVPPVFGGAPIFVSVFLGGREGLVDVSYVEGSFPKRVLRISIFL